MRRAHYGVIMAAAMALSITAYAAPKPDKSLLGVRVLSDWKAVLKRFGQPSRVEAGPVTSATATPMTSMGGAAMSSPPSLGGMMGMPGGPIMGGMMGPGGAPGSPMMGGMSSAGGPPGAPMMGGMSSAGGRGLPGLGGMGMRGGMTAPGGSSSMMAPPMMGGGMTAPGRPGMGGMTSAGGSSMMRPPMMSGGMSAPPMPGMGSPRMGLGNAPGIGAESSGMDLMAGAPRGPMGGMMGGMMGGGTMTSGGGTETGAGEVSWIYEKGTTTHVFLFNNEGRVIQIQSFGYKAGARTVNGVGLGDTSAKIYSVYGFPEETIVSGNTRTLDYSKKANVAFQLADRSGKGMRVVGITVGLVKAPDPENPER